MDATLTNNAATGEIFDTNCGPFHRRLMKHRHSRSPFHYLGIIPKFVNQILQLAFPSLIADGTIKGMFEEKKLKNISPHLPQIIRVRSDIHTICNYLHTRGLRLIIAINFYNTKSAGSYGKKPFKEAQCWDMNPISSCHLQDRLPWLCSNFSSIYSYSYHSWHPIP
jgi:hypothetical protein